MARFDPRLQIRNKDREPVCDVDVFDRCELILNLNGAGSFALTVPGDTECAELARAMVAAGDGRGSPGLVVTLDGAPVFNGGFLQVTTTEDDGGETVEMAGTDDLGRLAARLIEPCPFPYTERAYYTQEYVAERMIRDFVEQQAMNGFTNSDRVMDGLVHGPYGALGTVIKQPARFDPTIDMIVKFASVDGLRFWIDQEDTDLVFHVGYLRDQSRRVIYSRDGQTVSRLTRGMVAPRANYVVGGAKGDGATREFRVRANNASISQWGRWESFVDVRQSEDADDIDLRLDEALESLDGGVTLEIVPADDSQYVYGRDYRLGDLITAVAGDGTRYAVVVTAVELVGTPDGWTVTPSVATRATALSAAGRRLISPSARIGNLERNAETTNYAGSILDLDSRLDLAEAGIADLEDAVNTLETTLTTLQAGGITASMLAAGAALNNLGFTPSRIAQGQYTGNGASTQDITSLGFQPAFVWIYLAGTGVGVYPANQTSSVQLLFADAINENTQITMLSNGFRAVLGLNNTNGEIYVFTALG
jgi:hypothetical protein